MKTVEEERKVTDVTGKTAHVRRTSREDQREMARRAKQEDRKQKQNEETIRAAIGLAMAETAY